MAMTEEDLQCDRCKNILKNKVDIPILGPKFLTLDVSSSVVNKPIIRRNLKRERDKFLWQLKKNICALRNSKGGAVLVHISDIDPSDRCLDHFHELVDDRLRGMIEDGSLFVKTYKKDWLSDADDTTFLGYVAVVVEPSPSVVTVNFKTKEPLDNCIVDPSHITVVKLLNGESKIKNTNPNVRGLYGHFEESRNVQLKNLHPGSERSIESITKDIGEFLDYIWNNLKLGQYLAAFSKVDGGGSFYLGVEERNKEYNTYSSKTFEVQGIKFRSSFHAEFISRLKDKVSSELYVISDRANEANFRSENIVKAAFHEIDKENDIYILEVAVGAVGGVVFYDKSGPESYAIDESGNIVLIDSKSWYERLKKSKISLAAEFCSITK